MHGLQRTKQRYGMVTMCIGTGMGAAGLFWKRSSKQQRSLRGPFRELSPPRSGSQFLSSMLPGYFWSRIPERWRPAALRLGLNWFPAYRATGARLIHVSADLKQVVVRLPLQSVSRKNGAGTMFGGSLYSATDPIYALLLAANLGPDYIVWDKSAAIRYRKPGRGR